MMKRMGLGIAKSVVLWVVLVVGQVLGGALFFRGAPAAAGDGPLDLGQALLVANAADALILTALASLMRPRGWTLGLLLAVVLIGVQTAQSQIETVIYNDDIHMPETILLGVTGMSLLRAALAAAAIALLWRGRSEAQAPQLRGLAWKAPVIAAFYLVCYFIAGDLIAWSTPAVRAYYAHIGAFFANVDPVERVLLYGLQFGRGLAWCALAWLLARNLSGPAWRTALLIGVAFSGFMIPQALIPNPLMPWAVRSAHMVEVGSSNFIFGALTALLLLAGARTGAVRASGGEAPQTSAV